MRGARTLTWVIAALALIGVIDAAYLAYARATHSELACTVLEGCNIVAASPHSVLFGIVPLAYLGLAFYLVTFALALFLVFRASARARQILLAVTAAGFLASLYFVYVQAVLIEAFCLYCLVSAVTSLFLFFFAGILYRRETRSYSAADITDADLAPRHDE